MPAAAAPSPRQFSLGITLDPCADGLQVKTIDRRGALGRTGRVYEDDVIIAINDVSVLGKDTAELAALIHDGQNWYSGLDSVSTVTILGGGGPADGVVPQGQHPAAARGKKLTVVVTHLDSDVTERRPTAAPQRAGRVDLIEPRPVPADAVCSDSVGLGLTLRADASGKIRIADISAWGSARWTGNMAKNDVLEYIDGQPMRGTSARAAVEMLNGPRDAPPTIEIVYTRVRTSGEEEQKVIELGRAAEASQTDSNASYLKAGDGAPHNAPHSTPDNAANLLAALHAVRQMACHGDPLPQHPSSWALSQHFGINRAHGKLVDNVRGLAFSLATPDARFTTAHVGGSNGRSTGQSSLEAYHLVTECGRTRRELDDRMQAMEQEEYMAQEQARRFQTDLEEQQRQGQAELASLNDELAPGVQTARLARRRLEEERQDVMQRVLLRQQEMEDTSSELEQQRLADMLTTLRPQPQEIRAATDLLREERDQSVKTHGLLYTNRQRENRNLQEALATAEHDAGAWPAQRAALKAEEIALQQSVDTLTEGARYVGAQAAPLEGRRRQIIALLHRLDKEPWVAGLPPSFLFLCWSPRRQRARR
eukprot:Tamp_10234.p1 GENE.Tamp_10234~~Tamp_10234.p1  ORF type:complete len:594 (-),score=98.33 Tamp_10234:284-2065(-)